MSRFVAKLDPVSPAEDASDPKQTAQYLQVIDGRREDIRTFLARIIPAPVAPATSSPFVWELGCGHGHFLNAYAKAHPEALCIGVDIIGDRIARASKKRDRAKLSNLHFLHAEAWLFMEQLPPAARFSDIYILFPDPWPKVRHHKHRIMQADFLGHVARRAGEGARLFFRTDHAAYFEAASAVVRRHPDWVIVDEPWPFEQETVFQARAPSYQSLVARKRQDL